MKSLAATRLAWIALVLGGPLGGCGCDVRVLHSWQDDPGRLDGGSGYGRSPDDLGHVEQSRFGPTVRQAVPPPPISGGTLLVTRDGKTAVVADPDRDQV